MSIVFTGFGAVCGVGKTVDEIFDAIVNGRSAIAPITQFDAAKWPVRVAAECNVENKILVADRKLHKSISRTDLFGIYAADMAVQQSSLPAHREKMDAALVPKFNDRSGIISGSGGGTYRSSYDYLPLLTTAKGGLQQFGRELGNTVNPMWLLKNLPNNVLCHVGIRHNFKGTNTTITNQCAGGIMAVAESAAAIRAGEADRMTAIGHDSPFEPETVFHYHQLGLLSDDALRPFDRDRRGTVFGEGAAAVVLEKSDDAKARGVKIFGEFLGSGCVNEATGILDVRPDGDGVSRAIEIALADAKISRDEIGMIVAHGNGTRASDASEAIGVRRVFGEKIPPVTGFKWACGHLIAASGITDLVLALAALQKKIVPGIATLNSNDPEIAPFPISQTAQTPRGDRALVICRGFGGMNVALIVRAANS
ncbi:MAG TPA: beta-ketoacyl synthase N-terminal-like domain-containing protein [Candidatus Aquilonibacter sp.]|nr:beta-ketoacyl synthase N-terminal-like domain-containing protein [Candidatus Aquilonibacter sp.]